MISPRMPSRYLLASSLALSVAALSPGLAIASVEPQAVIPACSSAFGAGDARTECRLTLRNGSFESVDASGFPVFWSAFQGKPFASQGTRAPMTRIVGLAGPDEAVTQRVQLPLNTTVSPTDLPSYTVRFKAASRGGAAAVGVRLIMSDDQGEHAIALGSSTVSVSDGDWTDVELSANGQMFPQPAHLAVVIDRADGSIGSIVEIDDVELSQAMPALRAR